MIFSRSIAEFFRDDWGLDLSNIESEDLADRIGRQLGEVETIHSNQDSLKEVVVVNIVGAEKHPNADTLSVCLIDDSGKVEGLDRNQDNLVQVVCGAPNVRAGMYAAWLPPGSEVPSLMNTDESFLLESRKLRGEVSNGMLASEVELGIGYDGDGILEIPESEYPNVSPGVKFDELLELSDTIIDIENKMFTHRPDCFGQIGIAREIAGIYGQQFTSPDWYIEPLELNYLHDSEVNVVVSNEIKDLVPRFCALQLGNVKVGYSPLWLRTYLFNNGIKSINNIVDYTNYMSLLTGQPTHAFDLDKLASLSTSGSEVSLVARKAIKDESIELLDGKTRILKPEDIVIASSDKVVSLAGIMGGKETEVDESTTNVLIECATFNMYSIRKSSMRHGAFTDASTRFSKGQSPLQNEAIVKKLAADLVGSGCANAIRYFEDSPELSEPNPVKADAGRVSALLGASISASEIAAILRNVEFSVERQEDELTIIPPFWRTDIEIEEDIVEEIGRLHGYSNISPVLPARSIAPVRLLDVDRLNKKIHSILSLSGVNEIQTYSFVSADLLKAVGQDNKNSYEVSNALNKDVEYVRQSLAPSQLAKLRLNVKNGFDNFALYETGKQHLVKSYSDELPHETNGLSLMVVSKDKNAYYIAKKYLKHLADSLTTEFSVNSTLKDSPLSRPLNPSASGEVICGDTSIGVIGLVSEEVKAALKLGSYSIAFFELILDDFLSTSSITTYRPVSAYPGTNRDVTYGISSDKTFDVLSGSIGSAIERYGKGFSIDYDLVSIFKKQDEEVQRFTVSYRITPIEGTHSAESFNNLMRELNDKVIEDVDAVVE